MENASKFQKVIRRFTAVSAGLCLLTMAGTANAAFIDLTGTVTGGGEDGTAAPIAPFSSGDLLTGFIEINDAAATAGSSFDDSALLDYDLSVGSANFNFANSSPLSFFDGTVSSDGTTLTVLDATTDLAATGIPGCGACSLLLNSDAGAFVVSSLGTPPGFAGGFDLTATVRQQPTASVPEPSSVLLFGAGLLGLGLTRMRRS